MGASSSRSRLPSPTSEAAGAGPNVAVDANGNPIAADVVAFGAQRDTFWPRSVVTWVILSVVFIIASVQLVSPTRRWRFSRRRRSTTETPA